LAILVDLFHLTCVVVIVTGCLSLQISQLSADITYRHGTHDGTLVS
jgi:hypothetical protein